MKTLRYFLGLIWSSFFIQNSLGLCDPDILEQIPCGEGVLYESEALKVRETKLVSRILSSNLKEILKDTFTPEVLGCPDDLIVMNASMITSCLSTLDSRYLYVLAIATSSCRNDASLFEKSSWKATINLITEEIDLEDLCGLK